MGKIYVASLADYNAGILHGAWIDLDGKDAEDVNAEITEMLRGSSMSNAEEWAIHDSDDFDGITINEYATVADLVALSAAVEKHGQVLLDVLEYLGGLSYLEEAVGNVEDDYAGTYQDEAEFAEEFTRDTDGLRGVPDHIAFYIDWERMGNELTTSDFFTVPAGRGIHVFHNN
jgi:antirestriction protein